MALTCSHAQKGIWPKTALTHYFCLRARCGLEWPSSRLEQALSTFPTAYVSEISVYFKSKITEKCFLRPGWPPLPHPN